MENFSRTVTGNSGMVLYVGFQPLLMFDDGFQLVTLLLEVMVVEVEEFGEIPKGTMEGELPFNVGVGMRFLHEVLEILGMCWKCS